MRKNNWIKWRNSIKKKSPNLKIDTKHTETKYSQATKKNKENTGNYNSLIDIRDDDGNKLSHLITFNYDGNSEIENNKEDNFILIGNQEMLSNLKNNMINQYFMDCTFSEDPLSVHKYRLMVICGYNHSTDKTVLCGFILILRENEKTFEIFIWKIKFQST